MTWIDRLEIGLKEDAPFRKDNLPESQVRGPETPSGPGRSPVVEQARDDRRGVMAVEHDAAEAAATSEGMPQAKPDERADAGAGVEEPA